MHIWDMAGTGSRTTVDVSRNRNIDRGGLHLLRPVHYPLSHRRPRRARDDIEHRTATP